MAEGHRRPPPCRGRDEISAQEKIESRRGGEGPCPVRGGWPGTREPVRERGLTHATAQSEPTPCPACSFNASRRNEKTFCTAWNVVTQRNTPQLSFLFCSNRNRTRSQGDLPDTA